MEKVGGKSAAAKQLMRRIKALPPNRRYAAIGQEGLLWTALLPKRDAIGL